MNLQTERQFSFIVNPAAGKRNSSIRTEIEEFIADRGGDIFRTGAPGDAVKFSRDAVNSGRIPVAVGGDGTVNEVARGAAGSDREIGIIPAGSGNGFARHFNIPLNAGKALQFLTSGSVKTLDTGLANDEFFVMLIGAGFDAEVAYYMAKAKNRGAGEYVKIVLKQWLKRVPVPVKLTIGEQVIDREVFMIAAANTSQFGNNFYIAPEADAGDGLLNITVIEPFPLVAAPRILLGMMRRKEFKSRYVKRFTAQKITLDMAGKFMNIDGESAEMDMPVVIQAVPNNLKLIC